MSRQTVHDLALSEENYKGLCAIFPTVPMVMEYNPRRFENYHISFNIAGTESSNVGLTFSNWAFYKNQKLAMATITIVITRGVTWTREIIFDDTLDANLGIKHDELFDHNASKYCSPELSLIISEIVFGLKNPCNIFWTRNSDSQLVLTISDQESFAKGHYAQAYNAIAPAYPNQKFVLRVTSGRGESYSDLNIFSLFKIVISMGTIRRNQFDENQYVRTATLMKKGEDLNNYLIQKNRFLTDTNEIYALCIAMAGELYDMHKKDSAHQDVKPHNYIVVSENPLEIRLSDPDSAQKNIKGKRLRPNFGTPAYMPAVDCSKEQGDALALRRSFYFSAHFSAIGSRGIFQISRDDKKNNFLTWVMSDEFLDKRPKLNKLIVMRSCTELDYVTVADILCALLLSKYNLYECLGDLKLPSGLVEIILDYWKKNPECTLLQEESIHKIIHQIVAEPVRSASWKESMNGFFVQLREQLLPSEKSGLNPHQLFARMPNNNGAAAATSSLRP